MKATAEVEQKPDGSYWVVVDLNGQPERLIGVSPGPYPTARLARRAAIDTERALNTGGLTDF